MRGLIVNAVLLVVLMVGSDPTMPAELRYQGIALDHGVLGAHQSVALAINEEGWAAGSYLAGTSQLPFVWNGSQIQTLPIAPGDIGGVAQGINRSNVVIGHTYTVNGASRPTVWRNGLRIDLAETHPAIFASGAAITAINDAGLVTGSLGLGGGLGFRYDLNTGAIWLLADRDAKISNATSINAQGHVAGTGTADGNSNSALLSIPFEVFKLPDIGSGSDFDSRAYGINDLNMVVGQTVSADGNSSATLWIGKQVTQIFGAWSNGSEAHDINNRNQIVGSIRGYGGVLFQKNTLNFLDDLVNPAFLAGGIRHIQNGNAISDSSFIAGYGLVNGITTAMILTPVPETNTTALVVAGGFVVAFRIGWFRRAQAR